MVHRRPSDSIPLSAQPEVGAWSLRAEFWACGLHAGASGTEPVSLRLRLLCAPVVPVTRTRSRPAAPGGRAHRAELELGSPSVSRTAFYWDCPACVFCHSKHLEPCLPSILNLKVRPSISLFPDIEGVTFDIEDLKMTATFDIGYDMTIQHRRFRPSISDD
jgi:hypothetical protein